MSYLTKITLSLGLLAVPNIAYAATLCKSGLGGISIVEGPSKFGDQPPDSQSLKPTGKWPENLIEQGWHNLRKAARPLSVVCRYKDRADETIALPVSTDACFLRYGKDGLVVTCQ
jgi:hypothetical protein